MLDLKYVVENLEEVREILHKRGAEARASIDTIAEKAEKRRRVIHRLQELRTGQNQANALMAKLDKKSGAFAQQRDALRQIASEIKGLESEHREIEAEISNLLLHVPNLPADSTPVGKDASDNPLVRSWGQKPEFDFEPKDHTDLGLALGIIDFERATKISGARFSFLLGHGSRMIRALMAFMLDLHGEEHGYTEIWSPVIVKDETMRGTGQLPKFAADSFRIDWSWDEHQENQGHDLYLIPTAEVPVTNFHAGEILDAEQLPVTHVAYTACFRSEAGSYGKDTRGLIRQHQFDKVELVRVERPDQGEAALEKLTAHAEEVLKRLELHYQVVLLCSGDLGFGSRKTYDLEVWLPGQKAYREISSCSWYGDFQSRRANIRFRPAKGEKPKFVHTLNGSGLAIGRTFVAILEQYQQKDGSVRVPDALIPYMGGVEVVKARES
ncbi:MAG: serine--tRNA ligase [Deltaproteobacteria bacterium]|nr:serine--tRNA ligase [Deltaproteobacteria bacterium]